MALPVDARTREACTDIQALTQRLEEAGRTLLALPTSGYTTTLRLGSLEAVRGALEAAAGDVRRLRPAVPSAAHISRMDEALGWILLIPADRYVLRRIVGTRALVHPLTDRHLYPWRRIATMLGADHKAVQRWHAQGLGIMLAALSGRC